MSDLTIVKSDAGLVFILSCSPGMMPAEDLDKMDHYFRWAVHNTGDRYMILPGVNVKCVGAECVGVECGEVTNDVVIKLRNILLASDNKQAVG